MTSMHDTGPLIHIDPGASDGRPIFVGTNVPIDVVLASLDADEASARLQAAYPFMTPEHIAAAREWIELNGLRPRAHPSSTQIASESDSISATTASSPLLFHEALLDATRRRISRKSTQRLEPKLRCEIQVEDGSEEKIVGVVSLLERRADTVDVWCSWHRTDEALFPTLLHVPERASPWDQLFLFVLTSTGEFALDAFPSLASAHWHSARLQMPDVDGTDDQAKVTVTVDADSWVAVLASTRTSREAAELTVPEELRQQNIGNLLLEMASRLLFGKSGWVP